MVCEQTFSVCSSATQPVHHHRTTQPQSRIEAFDPLCEVQSDKASVEITSPYDGVVKELLVKEGEVAKVGEGLCVIEVEEEDDVTQRDESSASPPPHIEQEAAQHQDNTSLHVDQTVKTEDPVAPSSPKRRPHPLDPNVPSGGELSPGTNHADVLATPSVRHFARQKEVNLSQLIPGSGKNGRIEKRDIETFLARSAASAQSDAAQTTSARPEEDIAIELGRTRYNMWKAMVKVGAILCFNITLKLTNIPEFGDSAFWVCSQWHQSFFSYIAHCLLLGIPRALILLHCMRFYPS